MSRAWKAFGFEDLSVFSFKASNPKPLGTAPHTTVPVQKTVDDINPALPIVRNIPQFS